MSEIRRDKLADRWSVIAPQRAQRPSQHGKHQGTDPAQQPDACPFCPGNERLLPQIILETKSLVEPGWQVRVVPNKYPAMDQSEHVSGACRSALRDTYAGQGHHEVIIEHPRHDIHPGEMAHEDFLAVLETYRCRYRDLMAGAGTKAVILFRNHGPRAGASIAHPHSQVVSTSVVPPRLRKIEETARRYHARTNDCPHCVMVAAEREEARRVVLETTSFLAIVPYAAAVPFEVWLLPLGHSPDFGSISDAQLEDMTIALGHVLRAYRQAMTDPEYNLVIHSVPRGFERAAYLHWYIQILPRLNVAAGSELGTDMYTNAAVPEEDAAFLANAIRSLSNHANQ